MQAQMTLMNELFQRMQEQQQMLLQQQQQAVQRQEPGAAATPSSPQHSSSTARPVGSGSSTSSTGSGSGAGRFKKARASRPAGSHLNALQKDVVRSYLSAADFALWRAATRRLLRGAAGLSAHQSRRADDQCFKRGPYTTHNAVRRRTQLSAQAHEQTESRRS
jgi:hypothetical protein